MTPTALTLPPSPCQAFPPGICDQHHKSTLQVSNQTLYCITWSEGGGGGGGGGGSRRGSDNLVQLST